MYVQIFQKSENVNLIKFKQNKFNILLIHYNDKLSFLK